VSLKKTFNVEEVRRRGVRRLPRPFLDYLEGTADDGYTGDRNIEAFDDYELIPETLIDVQHIDTSVEVLGQKLDWPVFCAPTGASRMFHHEGERAVAKAAAKAGTLYSLSTVSTYSIEEIAALAEGPKMFQLYVLQDPGLVEDLIARAKASGYNAMCLTVDVPVLGNRELDLHNGMGTPPALTPRGYLSIAAHLHWALGFLKKPNLEFANLTAKAKELEEAGYPSVFAAAIDPSVTWARAAEFVKTWNGPFAVKGILSVDDAKRAIDIGATAIMVSNHGGRQLDGVPAPIDVVGDIADAVGDRIDIILDSGIRRGTHVVKALARGAKACAIGRPYLYGLAAGGEEGVSHVLNILRTEIERDMRILGCTKISDISDRHIRS
jgi:L-lactate dehydrogenase (cytochrome)